MVIDDDLVYRTDENGEPFDLDKYIDEKIKEYFENIKISKEDSELIITNVNKQIKKKTADDMFNQLGYITSDNLFYIKTMEDFNKKIFFDDEVKGIVLDFNIGENQVNPLLEMEELQVINKKCKELGWLEDKER